MHFAPSIFRHVYILSGYTINGVFCPQRANTNMPCGDIDSTMIIDFFDRIVFSFNQVTAPA